MADEGVSGCRVDLAEGPGEVMPGLESVYGQSGSAGRRYLKHDPALGQIPAQGGVVCGYRTLPGPATVSACQVGVPLIRGGQATGGITPAIRLSHKAQVLADWTLAVFFRRETAQLTFLEHPASAVRAR